jgi:hypothetical protein
MQLEPPLAGFNSWRWNVIACSNRVGLLVMFIPLLRVA